MYDMIHSLARIENLRIRAWGPPGPIPAEIEYKPSRAELQWLADMQDQGGIAHLLRSSFVRGIRTAYKLSRRLRNAYQNNSDVDLYHINWLQNSLLKPANNIPALVTVLGTDIKLLAWPGMKTALRHSLKKSPCILAPNAGWMVPLLEDVFSDTVLGILPVPFGIEKRWYDMERKVDYSAPRRWVSVIRITKKKIGELFNWGEKIFIDKDELHLYGPNQENIEIPPWVHYHGPVSPEKLANNIYPGAYAYVSLSQHDEGRPQAMLEAMAAALPIVASEIDAHRNLLQSTEGGFLVNNAETFSKVITHLAEENVHKQKCRAARDFVREKHGTWDDCARRYVKIYKTLLEHSN